MPLMSHFPPEYFAEVLREALLPSIRVHVPLAQATSFSYVLRHALSAEGYVRAHGMVAPTPVPVPASAEPAAVVAAPRSEAGKSDFAKMLSSMKHLTLVLNNAADKRSVGVEVEDLNHKCLRL